jgi:hypothetical protein
MGEESGIPDKPGGKAGEPSMPWSVLVQRTLGIAVAVALAGAAIYAVQRPDVETVPPTGAGTATAGPSPSTTSSTTTRGSTSATPADGALATAGPGLTEPGVHVIAQLGADGSLEVVERVRTSTPVGSLTVALPHGTGTGVAGVTPSVSGFQAQADGQVVTDMPASPLPPGGDRIDLPGPSSDIAMRYRMEGGTDRSQPAPVGRVLLVLPPITAPGATLEETPVVVEVVGGNIRNLVCPNLPVSDQLCGRQQGRVWTTAPVPLARALVIAQVDLPQPGN